MRHSTPRDTARAMSEENVEIVRRMLERSDAIQMRSWPT